MRKQGNTTGQSNELARMESCLCKRYANSRLMRRRLKWKPVTTASFWPGIICLPSLRRRREFLDLGHIGQLRGIERVQLLSREGTDLIGHLLTHLHLVRCKVQQLPTTSPM